MYLALAKAFGWTFNDIAEMSQAQQLAALDHLRGEQEGYQAGGDTMTFQDERAYRAWAERQGRA